MSLSRLRAFWRARQHGWLARRIPCAAHYHLSHRNLFILPTRLGWIFLAMTLTIFLLGSNYQNNLVLGLAYWMFSLFVVSIYLAHTNLSGMRVDVLAAQSGHAGEPAVFPLQVTSQRPRYDLQLSAPGAVADQLACLSDIERLQLIYTQPVRGRLMPPRVRLASQWPLGLLTCWTLLDLGQEAVIFPRLQRCEMDWSALAAPATTGGMPTQQIRHGQDEMQGLRPYRSGESLAQVAWKQVARGRGLVSKEFATPVPASCLLSLAQMTGEEVEMQLSKLAYQLAQLEQVQARYALDLGSVQIPPGTGPAHHLRCLTALALYVA